MRKTVVYNQKVASLNVYLPIRDILNALIEVKHISVSELITFPFSLYYRDHKFRESNVVTPPQKL